MSEKTYSAPIVHILKHGRSYCEMQGVPGEWPDNHIWISFQDQENAKEANCPECVSRRDAGPTLADRLNETNPEVLPLPDGKGGLRMSAGTPPAGVVFDSSGLHAMEDSTKQAAHFDRDLGRWHKLG